MQTLERYNATHMQAEPLVYDESEQFPYPVPRTEQHPPAEQPGDIDLDALGVSLSSPSLYMREVRRVTRLSSEVEQHVIEQARQGDQTAKHRLIEDRLPYIVHVAISHHVYAEHEDLTDIVGVANLAITAHIDKVLAKENPASYLCGIAKREIRNYCFYHSRLMPIKDHRMQPAEAPTVVSLDAHRASEYRYLGLLAQGGTPETDSAHGERLRQVLGCLSDQERQVVELRHNMQGSAGDFTDIARALHTSRSAVYTRYYRAMEKLRKVVAMSIPVLVERSEESE